MTYQEALSIIIKDGIEAARLDYTRPEQQQKLDGSILGFEQCRDRTPAQLVTLQGEAHKMTQDKFRDQAEDYWYWRCREAEIDWVCNVVSAILLNQGLPPISTCTARGVMKAADIIGVTHDG